MHFASRDCDACCCELRRARARRLATLAAHTLTLPAATNNATNRALSARGAQARATATISLRYCDAATGAHGVALCEHRVRASFARAPAPAGAL